MSEPSRINPPIDARRVIAIDNRRSRTAIAVITALLVLGVLCHLGFSVARQHRDSLSDAGQTTQNLVRVIEEQTRGGVNALDVTLASLARTIQLLPGREEPRNAEIHSLLRSTLLGLSFVRAVFVLDAQGNMIHDSDNLPGSFNLSDREYFRIHRDSPKREIYLDPPILSRLGVWFMATSRRIEKADGAFDGVVVAAIEPRYFEQFYESIKVGSTGVVALVRPDGTLVARAPEAEQMRGKKLLPPQPFVDRLPRSESGTYRAVSSVDGIERIYSYRKIRDRPLVVLVGLGISEALAAWRAGALAQGVASAILVLVIAWLGYLTLRELRRRESLNLELHQAERRLRDLIDGLGPSMFVGMLTPDGKLIEANAPALYAAGIQPQAVLGRTLEETYWVAYSEPVQRQVRAAIDRAAAGTPSRFDLRIRVREEQLIWIDFSIQPLRDHTGKIAYLVPSGIDITERLAAEKRARRLSDFYLALSRTNRAIIHMREAEGLYRDICAICVEQGHASIAYIGLIAEGQVKVTAWAGPAEPFISGIALPLDAALPEGRGPIATAIRERRPYICNDFHADPVTAPWRERAQYLDTEGTAAIPFSRGGKVAGALSLHVGERGFFDDQLIALLEEMVANMSFALDNFDREVARGEAS